MNKPVQVNRNPGLTISVTQARCLQLAAQGLLRKPARHPTARDMLSSVARMQLLQIDTIHVVARSPYLVLFSRLGAYDPAWLDQALADAQLAECWAHEACLVPAADYPLHRSWLQQRGNHWAQRHAARMRADYPAQMTSLLGQVRAAGEMRSSDFERVGEAGAGWWSWKPEKRWLEAWFALGELMVARRERFQRVYAPAETIMARLEPAFDSGLAGLTPTELRQRFVCDSVRALGITQARWIADYYRLTGAVSDAELQPWVASGELLRVTVVGWQAPAYVHRDHASLLDSAIAGKLAATHTTLLSPFDPLVWDRVRLRAMFDFDYALECYTPEARRQYGYFVLPILRRGRLVGRLDAKAHRREGIFEIKQLYLEPGIMVSDALADDLAMAISRCAHWHGTPGLRLTGCQSRPLARALRQRWK